MDVIGNNLVLLTKEESSIWEASKGTLGERGSKLLGKHGIVGHNEYSRRSMKGLAVQVSRELWAKAGSTEMVLLKIGCNITPLREFEALCQMDSTPLLGYILCGKMPYNLPRRRVTARPLAPTKTAKTATRPRGRGGPRG